MLAFKDKDVPCEVIIDNSKYLPEFSDKQGAESCIGGAVFFAKRGRIVCSNTLEDRLKLVFSEAIPHVRKTLFPNFRRGGQ